MGNIQDNRVELRPAFSWTCPECGRDKFERCVVVELSEEERQELQEDHGIQPWETGDFYRAPESVTCDFCCRSFQTEDFNQELDD